jgi:hypothetical protein
MRRDWFGSFIALVVFFAGIAMIYGVFQQAWVLFETPPVKALAIEKAKPMDVNVTGTNLVWVLVRILILFLLAVCGSLIANKGVSLFAASRHLPSPKKSDPDAG